MPRVFLILLLLAPCLAQSDLARRISAALQPGEPVELSLRSIGPGSAQPFRSAIETELKGHPTAPGGASVAVTLAEGAEGFLLIAEIARGGRREAVLMERVVPPAEPEPIAELRRKLIAERNEPILDVLETPNGVVLLTPGALVTAGGKTLALPAPPAPWPRDLRGRLTTEGATLRMFLPGVACTANDAALDCKPAAEPWPGMPEGSFLAAGANMFSATGAEPFISAARAGNEWVVTRPDGAASLLDSNRRPVATIAGWGTEIAAVESPCGTFLLATTAWTLDGPETVQAFTLQARQPVRASAPLAIPGALTALWQSADRASAVAIAKDTETGRYAAYSITVACGR